MQKCDILRYSASEISEGWQLIVEGADDPDPDRRVDITAAYLRLPEEERAALLLLGMGWTHGEIARVVLGSNHRSTGKRLVDRAVAHLKGEVNG